MLSSLFLATREYHCSDSGKLEGSVNCREIMGQEIQQSEELVVNPQTSKLQMTGGVHSEHEHLLLPLHLIVLVLKSNLTRGKQNCFRCNVLHYIW